MLRVIVLGGCGQMASEATRDLARTSKFDEIVIADANVQKARELAEELGGGRVLAIPLQIDDETLLADALRGFDVVLNGTTYHFGLIATRAAIRARAHYLDLGGLFNTPRQLELDSEAREAGVTICLGCGATPGITNLMAQYSADRLDQVDSVHIAFASFRAIAPSPGLLDTILDEFSPTSQRFYWEDGRFVETPAFSGSRRVRFPEPVGEIETYFVPHSETHALPRFMGKGLRRVDVRGTWRPEIMQALRLFVDLKLNGDGSIRIGEHQFRSKDFLRQHILNVCPDFAGDGEWAFLLNTETVGRRSGKTVRITANASHPPRAAWGTTATARMTGIPASIGAQKLASGDVKRKGVVSPDACFEPQPFFAELDRRGIRVGFEESQRDTITSGG